MWYLIILGILAPIIIPPTFGNQWKNKIIKNLLIIIQFLVLLGVFSFILYFCFIDSSPDFDSAIYCILLLMIVHLYGVFYLGFRDDREHNKWLKSVFVIIESLVLLLLFYSFLKMGWVFLFPFLIQTLWVLVIFPIIKNKKIRKIILWLSVFELIFGVFLIFGLMLAGGFARG